MDAKFTPGPWHAMRLLPKTHSDHGYRRVAALDHRSQDFVIYAEAANMLQPGRGYVWGGAEADARLLAAAPELLAELTKRAQNAEESAFDDWVQAALPSGDVTSVKRQWEESVDYKAFLYAWQPTFDVIAKATGA